MKMEDSVLSIKSSGKGKRTEAVVGIVERRPSLPAVSTSQVYEDDYHIKTNGYVESAVDRDYMVYDDEHLRHNFHDHHQEVFFSRELTD